MSDSRERPGRIPVSLGRVHRLAIPVLLAAAAVSCRPEIEVLLETTVYRDGSIDRVLEIVGWTQEGERPTESTWMTNEARLDIAHAERWARVERAADRIRAEGFFLPGEPLPGTLLHLDGVSPAADRSRVEVSVEDLVVITRWTFRETYGDPYGRDAAVRAVDALLDLAAEALEGELRAAFGDRANVEGAVRRLRTEGRALALEILEAHRMAPGAERRVRREGLLSAVLERRGVSGERIEDESFWESRSGSLRTWIATRLAEALSTEEERVSPAELSVLPDDLSDEAAWSEIVERTWGGDEQLWERARPPIETLQGYYGGEADSRYSFRARVTLPGSVVATNGAPVQGGAAWLFRGEDLRGEDRVLSAESVEQNDEALRALGARRTFDTFEMLQLRDLLVMRDPDGLLRGELRVAEEEGSLDRLRDEERVDEDVAARASELADLLDPEGETRRR